MRSEGGRVLHLALAGRAGTLERLTRWLRAPLVVCVATPPCVLVDVILSGWLEELNRDDRAVGIGPCLAVVAPPRRRYRHHGDAA